MKKNRSGVREDVELVRLAGLGLWGTGLGRGVWKEFSGLGEEVLEEVAGLEEGLAGLERVWDKGVAKLGPLQLEF